MAETKHILLIISGSIAAVKSYDLIRGLRAKNMEVTCVLTKGGGHFVTPMACSSLTGRQTYTELFSLSDEVEMGHIALSRAADLIVVAPASADIIAKMAHGLCDDLATTLLLATNKPVFIAPAMNVKMWEHPATIRNVKQLREDGIQLIDPENGDLACGEKGEGRMAEPEAIIRRIADAFKQNAMVKKNLKGYRALVTSGPTYEAIDPVRYLANRSSGKQGHAIATALSEAGAEVTLISGPTNQPTPPGVILKKVESAEEMFEACLKVLPVDIAVCAAAVSDWRPEQKAAKKMKRQQNPNLAFNFMQNPDILQELSRREEHRPDLVIGFAAETDNVIENAREKHARKGCDWLLANDVSGNQVFGAEMNKIYFLNGEKEIAWPELSKRAVGDKLVEEIAQHFSNESKAKRNGFPKLRMV